MPNLTNPAEAQYRATQVLGLMGSFWTSLYRDNGTVFQYARGRNEAELQAFRDLMELVACTSRFDVPIYHRKNWSVLTLRQSQKLPGSLLTYGTPNVVFGNNYFAGGVIYQYGVSPNRTFAFSADSDLADVSVIVNRISEPSIVLTKNIDFRLDIDHQFIEFREDPFANLLIPRTPVYDNSGNVIDIELQLWLFMGDYDWNFIYEQFGYVLNLHLTSSENYKELVNVIFDALVLGSTFSHLESLLALLTDSPLVIETEETIEDIYNEVSRKLILTNKNVYVCNLEATPVVSIGESVKAGDSLVDAYTIYRPYRDTITPNTLPALSVGTNILVGFFNSDLLFNNQNEALQVSTDANGRTRVEWILGGLSGDVKHFWDTVHTNGTAEGATSLAQLLDTRIVKIGDPLAVDLPLSVNPLDFLMKNILRNNADIVIMNSSSFGADAHGLGNWDTMRQVLPAHNMLLIFVKVEVEDEIEVGSIGTEVLGKYTAPDILVESSPFGFVGSETIVITLIPEG